MLTKGRIKGAAVEEVTCSVFFNKKLKKKRIFVSGLPFAYLIFHCSISVGSFCSLSPSPEITAHCGLLLFQVESVYCLPGIFLRSSFSFVSPLFVFLLDFLSIFFLLVFFFLSCSGMGHPYENFRIFV